MTDEYRRSTDPRIDDIQSSIHDLDRRLVIVETRQEAFEDSMEEAHAHLHDKIDSVRSDLRDGVDRIEQGVSKSREEFAQHVAEEASDRKTVIKTMVTLIVSLLMSLGAWALTAINALQGGG